MVIAEEQEILDARQVDNIEPQTIEAVEDVIEEAPDPHLEEIKNTLLPDEREVIEKLDRIEAEFTGPAKQPSIFELLIATRRDNPVLTQTCREEARNFMLDAFAKEKDSTRDEAIKAADLHIMEMQKIFSEKKISHADYLKHVSECKVFCQPMVAHLINCHVNSVANLDHSIVLFELDSEIIKPGYEVGTIENIARILRSDSGRNVLLIGRASRIGSLEYNRSLSARRTLAVQQALVAKGVKQRQINPKWFGWEEPQIWPWVATEYGLEYQFEEFGMQMMNQSVMLVLY